MKLPPAAGLVFAAFCASFCCPLQDAASEPPPLVVDLVELPKAPPRSRAAGSGSDFARRTPGDEGSVRQRAAVGEIVGGNLPSFLRELVPVRLEHRTADGRLLEGTVWVTADYVALGSDDDFLRVPLTYSSATAVATAFDCVLPTTRIVDAVWRQADVRLDPAPLPPGPRMRTMGYYLRHRQLIEGQRRNLPPGQLLAGHKKDVVLTRRLLQRRSRIAIYGWHRRGGDPIQPLSTVHGANYADYSHGVRLVWSKIRIGRRLHSIYDVLADRELAPLLSDEGVIPEAWGLMHPDELAPGAPQLASARSKAGR